MAPLSFAFVAVFAPNAKKNKKITRGTSLRVSRQCRPSQNWHWGLKTATDAKLREPFCSFFFLGGQIATL